MGLLISIIDILVRHPRLLQNYDPGWSTSSLALSCVGFPALDSLSFIGLVGSPLLGASPWPLPLPCAFRHSCSSHRLDDLQLSSRPFRPRSTMQSLGSRIIWHGGLSGSVLWRQVAHGRSLTKPRTPPLATNSHPIPLKNAPGGLQVPTFSLVRIQRPILPPVEMTTFS